MLTTVWVDRLNADHQREVLDLLHAAREADGEPDLADGDLPGEFRGGRHLLDRIDRDLVGYAHLDPVGDSFGRPIGELIVRPDRRRRGYGVALARSLAAEAVGELRVWARGDHPGARRIATELGFARARELLVMRVDTNTATWPDVVVPPGIRLREFVPGQDEHAVIEVNRRAFDWHPEQGRLSVAELRANETEDWFDPTGFFLAENTEGRVVGFHWTKVHPANPHRFGGEPVGEVYVVGVDPTAQGGGLGKLLTVAGLRYLARSTAHRPALGQIILYVEGDNAPAIAVYTKLGFTRQATNVQYAR